VRQAVLYCLQFAMDAVDKLDASEKTVRLEANADSNQVQILVAHTGSPFPFPARAFDPFVPEPAAAESSTSLGLSMCATILRENNGRASAVNFEPRGAGILLELQAA
jgi:C4-dicarboxylate-specific signal transduction histidine kinase